MTPIDFDPHELPPELDPDERATLSELAVALVASRPRPSPGFRGAVRRETFDHVGGLARRPPRLRRRVATFIVTGAALVLIAASGLSGSGPLAAPHEHGSRVAQGR